MAQEPKNIYVPAPIVSIMIGVIFAITALNPQLKEVAKETENPLRRDE
jgi:hypothetical protein